VLTVALWTVKGGVGKTSAAVNLAHLASREGFRTVLWDLDAQGAASFLFRVKPRKRLDAKAVARRSQPLAPFLRATDFANLDIVPAGLALRHLDIQLATRKQPARRLAAKLEPLGTAYDVAFLDCPPSVSVISEAVVQAVDAILVPVIPTPLSLRSLADVRRLAAELGGGAPAVLPFLSMVDRRKALHRQIAARFAEGADGFLRTVVPLASAVEQMALRRMPLTAFAPASPAARAYAALWAELRGVLASRRQKGQERRYPGGGTSPPAPFFG